MAWGVRELERQIESVIEREGRGSSLLCLHTIAMGVVLGRARNPGGSIVDVFAMAVVGQKGGK